MAFLFLAKSGYGSLNEVKEWDTKQLLDALEYEAIDSAIARYLQWKAENS